MGIINNRIKEPCNEFIMKHLNNFIPKNMIEIVNEYYWGKGYMEIFVNTYLHLYSKDTGLSEIAIYDAIGIEETIHNTDEFKKLNEINPLLQKYISQEIIRCSKYVRLPYTQVFPFSMSRNVLEILKYLYEHKLLDKTSKLYNENQDLAFDLLMIEHVSAYKFIIKIPTKQNNKKK